LEILFNEDKPFRLSGSHSAPFGTRSGNPPKTCRILSGMTRLRIFAKVSTQCWMMVSTQMPGKGTTPNRSEATRGQDRQKVVPLATFFNTSIYEN